MRARWRGVPRRVPEGWCPERWPRKVGGPKGGVPKFSRFFSLSRHYFHSFLPLLLVVEFWWCDSSRDPQMCTFGVLGLSCEAPAAPKPPGPHTTARAHPRVPALKNTTEDTQRDTKERNGGRERGSQGEGESGGRGVILDEPTKILNTHHNTTPQHDNAQGGPWSQKQDMSNKLSRKAAPLAKVFNAQVGQKTFQKMVRAKCGQKNQKKH